MRSIRIARARNGLRGALLGATALSLCLPLAACSLQGAGATPGDTLAATPSVSADATVPLACSLLSADLIEASTGVTGAKGKLNKDLSTPGTSVCEWKGEKADLPSIQVLITALGGEPGATPGATPAPAPAPGPSASASQGPIAAQRASAEATLGVTTDAVVAGGTDAFVVANGSVVGMSFEKVNTNKVKRLYYVQVTYTTGDTSDVTIITKALAALVASSM
jgi:hypothetical protein